MGRVIVESPFAGHRDMNADYLKACLRDCVNRGEVPFASHGFFVHFLNEDLPDEREMGIKMGYDFWEKADKVVFYMDLAMSKGMQSALIKAFAENKPIERRQLPEDMWQEFHKKWSEGTQEPVKKPVNLDALAKDLELYGTTPGSIENQTPGPVPPTAA